MALGFGRKKAADDAPLSPDVPVAIPDSDAAPVAAHAPSSPNADALDFTGFQAIADGDDADAAFNFPATPDVNAPLSGVASSAPTVPSAPNNEDEDAIDFDKLYAIEQQNAAQVAAHSAAPAPFVPPTATPQDSATPFYEPQVPVETAEAPKKKLPLLPILGAVAFLALAGGAASYFASQSSSAPDDTEPVTPTIVRPRGAPPQATAPNAGTPDAVTPATGAAPNAPLTAAPGVATRPSSASPQAGAPNAGTPNAGTPNAGGRPETGRIGGLSSASAVSPGIAPISAQTNQLKALWKRGANAKHQGDYAGARRYWNQGLKIEPRNVGFRESIAKLPR